MTNSLLGRVAVVTGANSGVGRSATEMLLRAGAHVTMICRSHERGAQALAELRHAKGTGNESGGGRAGELGGPRVMLELADLSRQDDVRRVAERIAARLPAIDILVNNAGILRRRRVLSVDGFELTFATNYLSHFLLTRLLLDRLEAGRGRVVNVSSCVHRVGALRRAGLDDIARGRAWRGGMQAYSDSKLANILFTFESVRRWTGRGVTANALHPGVLWTGIWNVAPRAVRTLIRPFSRLLKKPEVGGAAVMSQVRDPAGDAVSGCYFNVQVAENPSLQAQDPALARELWEQSLVWTGNVECR